ncbi:sigma-70 RNA polymerase sigma factor region 4 domain-containing protein [Burkholderia cepacia]|uniref:hypothetical protein n=1 Tax=Burkholderia cepacia TaxID=292 RepID=UPI002AB68E6B|nr:hypothetical protein [Burkholderia cepacia]
MKIEAPLSSSAGGPVATPEVSRSTVFASDRLVTATADWIAHRCGDEVLARACMSSARLLSIVRRAAFLMRLDETEAEDIRQDLSLYLLARGREALATDPTKVYAWLTAVALSAARGRMRRRDHHTVKLDALVDVHGQDSTFEERIAPVEVDYVSDAAQKQAAERFAGQLRGSGGVPPHLSALAPVSRSPLPDRREQRTGPSSGRGGEPHPETPLFLTWKRTGYTRSHVARLAGVTVASVTAALRGSGNATVRARITEVINNLPQGALTDVAALVREWMGMVSPDGGTERQQLDALSKVAGVGRVTLYYWYKGTHQPTSDKLNQARNQVEKWRKMAERKKLA